MTCDEFLSEMNRQGKTRAEVARVVSHAMRCQGCRSSLTRMVRAIEQAGGLTAGLVAEAAQRAAETISDPECGLM